MFKIFKRLNKRKKVLLFSTLLLILIIIIFFGTKFYLYINFLLGNDIIITLNTDKEFLSLGHGEEGKISFDAKITTNPFCKATCISEFLDISNMNLIEKDSFSLKPGFPIHKEFYIKAPNKGQGLKVYRFNMECHSVNTALCHTKEEPTTRNILVMVNYTLTEDENILKGSLKQEIYTLGENISLMKGKYKTIEDTFKKLNETVTLKGFKEDLYSININILNLSNRLYNLQDLWKEQDLILIKEEVDNISVTSKDLLFYLNNLEYELKEKISLYNDLLLNLSTTKEILENITDFSEDFGIKINNTILEFNDVLDLFQQKNTLNQKEEAVQYISNKTTILLGDKIDISETNFSLEKIEPINLKEIKLEELIIVPLKIELLDPPPICCVFGECNPCCLTEDCRKDSSKYPIIFLHGHAVNKVTSAEYSLERFNKLQKAMEKEGYLNAGSITLYTKKDTPKHILGFIDVPITLRASYYYDIFKEPENYIVVQGKSENIDTYAIRLKELIDIIKFKTGRPKVNIIAFSMGGLVARRYIQIFGADKVEKLILIGTPNKGIEGNIQTLCPVVGEMLECRDMNSNSLFIKKLNTESSPEINIYNIVGTGCDMAGKMGDGIVLENNARLENADNYIIKGKCRKVTEPLHLDLLDIDLYPRTYNIIKTILKKTN